MTINSYSNALCGSPATRETTGNATKLCAMKNRSQIFVSGGNRKNFFFQILFHIQINLKFYCRKFALVDYRYEN